MKNGKKPRKDAKKSLNKGQKPEAEKESPDPAGARASKGAAKGAKGAAKKSAAAPSKAPTQQHILLRISPKRRPHSGHVPIGPSVPPPRPPDGPKDLAHQAKIIRLDKPPYQGTVIHNPSPTGV